MKLHGNAALTLKNRRTLARRIGEEGWPPAKAALQAGVTTRTARKWADRYREDGEAGLLDRPSTPRRVWNRTDERRTQLIAYLRRLRMTGPEIGEVLVMPTSTVSAVLQRIGLGKLSRLQPPESPNRYEKSRPGELLHLDVKKLGRISIKGAGHRVTGHKRSQVTRRNRGPSRGATGWEFCHVCVDDATRLAFVEVLADERARTAVAFLGRCLGFYRAHGVEVERVMTDNGSAYVSAVFALACRTLGIKHSRTRPYRPRTNGKAERFIRTMLAEWAYAAIYGSSKERTLALSGWLERYNTTRRHGALGHRPPIVRLRELAGNNLAGIYS
jgi:transposase InsO family protein